MRVPVVLVDECFPIYETLMQARTCALFMVGGAVFDKAQIYGKI